MILKMEKLSAFALLADKDDILNSLMRKRCVQLTAPETLAEYEQLREYTSSTAADIFTVEQKLSRYNTALSGMSFFIAKKGLFEQRPRILYDNLEDGDMLAKADAICEKVEGLLSQMADWRARKSKDLFLKASLEPWAENDLELAFSGTRETAVMLCLLPARIDMTEMEAKLAEAAPACHIEQISADREQIYLCAVCHRAQADDFWDALKTSGASRASFPGLEGTARENIAAADKRVAECDAGIAKVEEQLRDTGKDVFPLQYGVDVLSVRIQRGKANDELLSTQKTFCFTGWVPENAKVDVVATLERYGCYYEFVEPTMEEEPPVLLKNNAIAQPYEAVTQMYSLPSYWGFDPNNFVSVFYFVFFGMMLSDAGVGLVLFIGGLIMGKKADLGAGAKKLVKVLTWGGFSAVIWGCIFGSFFGDTIPVISKLWFGKEIVITPLLDPLGQAVEVMILCLAFGVVHIFFGLGIKAYMLIKRGKALDAVFDVGFWMLFMVGLIMMLVAVAGPMMFGTDMPVVFMDAGKYVAIIGAAGLVLTQGRDKKNIFMKLVSGVMSLYDITGYLSDVLSYSRILALGLATGVIAQVFNIMGTLGGGGIVGIIIFIPIFVLGTALNTGINTLGSYVHTARLQYVEFFGKFYEAGGKPFSPLMAQTKYIVVTNKEEN